MLRNETPPRRVQESENYYNGQYHTATLSNEIVVKSPNKLHDSPAKKRSYLSPYKSMPYTQLKLHNEVTPDQNQYRPFRSKSAALPSMSPLENEKRAIEIPQFVFQKSQNNLVSKTSKSCNRRLVLVVGLIVSIGLSFYCSINGSFYVERVDEMENTQRYLTSLDKTDATTPIVAVSSINFSKDAKTDVIEADVKEIPDGSVTGPLSSATKSLDNLATEASAVLTDLLPKSAVYLSPYTVYHKNQTHPSKFAYAYVISGCNEDAAHRNYLYDISISTYVQREAGSTADVIVFIQMAFKSDLESLPDQDRLLMEAMNIQIQYIPKAEDESFYRTMLDKFLILGLTQYDRILFMDGDVMTRGSLDYLFDLSMKGVLKKNVVTAGKTEPANGGFFMLTPSKGASERVMAIILDKEKRGSDLPYPHWDEEIGWGHTFGENDFAEFVNGKKKDKWDFYGAFADQGLLYQWVKYEEKSVSIIFRRSVQNWDQNENGTVHLEQTLNHDIFKDHAVDRTCWKFKMPCKTPFSDFVHFTGRSKPWLVSPPDGFETDAESSPSHFWYNTLYILNQKMKLGIEFAEWRQFHRPYLGMFPTHSTAAKTSYALQDKQTNLSSVES